MVVVFLVVAVAVVVVVVVLSDVVHVYSHGLCCFAVAWLDRFLVGIGCCIARSGCDCDCDCDEIDCDDCVDCDDCECNCIPIKCKCPERDTADNTVVEMRSLSENDEAKEEQVELEVVPVAQVVDPQDAAEYDKNVAAGNVKPVQPAPQVG